MKILGEKSLASKVEVALEVAFMMIALLDIGMVGLLGLVLLSETTRYYLVQQYLWQAILLVVVLVVLLATGLIALYILQKFIQIFQKLKQNKPFDRSNIICFQKIYVACMMMAILYVILLFGLNFYNHTIYYTMGEKLLLNLFLLVFAIGFFVFGIGIKILNEIYKVAVENKEENDFTI